MNQIETDFCVVGAGISGMTAAYRLLQAGKRVVVIEAGDRIGGRIWTSQLSDGSVFEIGAEWISEDSLQHSVRQLMKDLEDDGAEFELAEQYIGGQNIIVDFDGNVGYYYAVPPPDACELEYDGLPPISEKAKVEIVAAFASLAYMSTQVDLEKRWRRVDLDPALSGGVVDTVEADTITLGNWMKKNMSHPMAKALVAAMFKGVTCLEPEAVSLLHAIFFLSTFGCDPQNVMGAQKGQAQHLRMPNGVEQIIREIEQRLGSDAIYKGSPVRDIIHTGDGQVIVKSELVTVTARRVIVATTSAAANLIRFQPPLPPDRAQLQQRMGIGSAWKIWLAYDRPFWRPDHSGSIVCVKEDAFVTNTLDSTLDPDGPGLLTCFVDADKAREFAGFTRERRRQTVIDEMARAFGDKYGDAPRKLSETIKFPAVGPQNPEPDAYFEFNWSLPEFIRGDYAGTPGPGVYTAYGFGPAITKNCDRIHWAGSDTGTGKDGYGNMSNAAETGTRAAHEVLKWEDTDQGNG
jgi:monoamine oxidase